MRTKIILVCVLCALFALIIQSFFFQYTAASLLYKQEEEFYSYDLENLMNDFYLKIKSYENSLIQIYNQKELFSQLEMSNKNDIEKNKSSNIAYNLSITAFDPEQGLKAIYIYDNKNKLVSNYRVATTKLLHYPEDIYQQLSTVKKDILLNYLKSSNRVMLVTSEYNSSKKKYLIRFILKIFDVNLSRSLGYIVCDVDQESFLKIIKKNLLSNNKEVFIQNNEKQILIKYGEVGNSYINETKEIEKIISDSKFDSNKNQIINNIVIFRTYLEKYSLNIFCLAPQNILNESQFILRNNLIIIAIIILIIAFISSYFMANFLTIPLNRMVKDLKKIKEGNIDIRLTGYRQDEIGLVGDTINEMMEQIKKLMIEEYKLKLETKQAQYKALQAQVNPHFLYNTLNVMGSIAEAQNCSTVNLLCQAMSNMFRYSLKMDEKYSTLQDEIIHIKNYMYIINIRNEDEIELKLDIDTNLLNLKLPKLTLQPLIENAIKHGFINKSGNKKIIVKCVENADTTNISVVDNGIGFSNPNIKNDINNDEDSGNYKGNSIGLRNINSRIKLFFGEKYGLDFETKAGAGSTVILILPKFAEGYIYEQ